MIVIMAKDTSPADLEGVKKRIESHPGLRPQVFDGVERIVVGVLGSIPPDLKDEIELLQGVLEVVPISKPYKLASREFHPDNSRGSLMGGTEIAVPGSLTKCIRILILLNTDKEPQELVNLYLRGTDALRLQGVESI